MSPGAEILLCGIAAFGLPIFFGMRELLAPRRPPTVQGGEGGVIPEPDAPRPNLPDCLVPRPDALAPLEEPAAARPRELEPA